MILIDAERLAASRPEPTAVRRRLGDDQRRRPTRRRRAERQRQEHAAAHAGRRAATRRPARFGGAAAPGSGSCCRTPCCRPGTVREAVGGEWQGEAMLDRLGMTPLLDAPTDELSGGQAKRAALARLLVGEYEVLILDEPTNHLDLDAIQFLEEWLAAYRGGLVLVTHDRHVLDKVTTKVLELDRGTAYLHVPTGWHAGSGLCGLPRRSRRTRGAGRGRRAGPQEPGHPRAGLAAPRCPGPHLQAEGPHRHRDRAGRGQGAGRGTRRRSRPVDGVEAAGVEGHRADRRRLRLARRHAR